MEEKDNGKADHSQWQAIERNLQHTLRHISHLGVVSDEVAAVRPQLDQVIKVGGEDDAGDGQEDAGQHAGGGQQAHLGPLGPGALLGEAPDDDDEEGRHAVDDVDQVGVVVEAAGELVDGRHVQNFSAKSYFRAELCCEKQQRIVGWIPFEGKKDSADPID